MYNIRWWFWYGASGKKGITQVLPKESNAGKAQDSGKLSSIDPIDGRM
jgi:hypothetical protein